MSRPDNEGGGFLGRWARLKQESQREPAVRDLPAPTADASTDAGTAAEARASVAARAPTQDLPLPSLDSIVPGADISAFFQAHVPEALRNAALRKVWSTDPEISGFIEMADYQWDFNNPDAIPGWGSSLQTSDISRLAERLMGGGEQSAPQATGIDAMPRDAALPTNKDFPEDVPTADTSDAPAASGDIQPQAASSENPEHDGAVQKRQFESGIYTSTKKRHGGALPS